MINEKLQNARMKLAQFIVDMKSERLKDDDEIIKRAKEVESLYLKLKDNK